MGLFSYSLLLTYLSIFGQLGTMGKGTTIDLYCYICPICLYLDYWVDTGTTLLLSYCPELEYSKYYL